MRTMLQPPETRSENWQFRVSADEKRAIQDRAEAEGWKGYQAWLRERLKWARELGRTAADPATDEPRGAILNVRLSPSELRALRDFAATHGLDLAGWARAVCLHPNARLRALPKL